MEKSKTYCVMPHVGVALQNGADYCCCNMNTESWQDSAREVIRVYSHPLQTAVRSHTRKILATALDRNIRHPSCKKCWDLEDSQNRSPRQAFNEKFKHLIGTGSTPRVLIIKPGNTCNFACRMCNPLTSSSWYADGHELEKRSLGSSTWYSDQPRESVDAMTYNEYTKTFETVRQSFGSANQEFWSTLKQWMAHLEFIDIYGGEPFLSPAMFDLLQHGADTGDAEKIELNLHTNVSIYNEKYAQALSKYKEVALNFSVDSMDPAQFAYIRHRGNIETTATNLNRFKDFFQLHRQVKLRISLTVTPLNVFYIDQIQHDLKQAFGLPVNINIVTTPEYDIRHLPIAVKSRLIRTLRDQTIVNFLKQTIPGCDIEWPKFCRVTEQLDQLRNQSFASAFPDWWTVLEPFWAK